MSFSVLSCVLAINLLAVIPTTMTGESRKWGETIEGCRISLTADKPRYRFGDSIDLRVLAQNIGRDRLEVFGTGYFGCEVEVYLPNGHPAPTTIWGELMLHPKKVSAISAGGTILLRDEESRPDDLGVLNRAFDMSLDGKYAIVVRKMVRSGADPNSWIEVRSNPITIEVVTGK